MPAKLAFPADAVREPFVDVDDVADVVTGLMLGEIPAGQVYELTGPGMLTFAEATAIIAKAAGATDPVHLHHRPRVRRGPARVPASRRVTRKASASSSA